MSDSVFKLVSSQPLAKDWGHLTKYTFDLRRRDGTWQRQIREVYDRGHGAVCLLYNPQSGCVLLTRQFRLPVFLSGGIQSVIEAPAGMLEGAEPAERMRGELIEETGYDVSELVHLFDAYMSPGALTEHLAFFYGEYSEKQKVGSGGGVVDEGEDIEVLQIEFAEALRMIQNGDICDAKTIILLQHLAIKLLQERD